MTFPEPVISIAIEPTKQADIDKFNNALMKLSEEDPTLVINTDEDSGQTIMKGMGELHLDIIMDRLKREFNVDCNQGAPQVAYKEAITTESSHREVFKKQTGGRGKFADIVFSLSPADEGVKGLQFINEVKGGNIPKEFIPAVEKGFKAAMQNGVLAGFPLESMKVVLSDGSYHPVDSDALSFELCAKMAFKEAAKKARPVLLEPIMSVEVNTPDAYLGDVTGDLNRRRAILESITAKIGVQAVKAKVPLAQMFGYVTSLRTITSGRANSTMEFSHYAEAPKDVTENVLKSKAE
jgi:elongation factor G